MFYYFNEKTGKCFDLKNVQKNGKVFNSPEGFFFLPKLDMLFLSAKSWNDDSGLKTLLVNPHSHKQIRKYKNIAISQIMYLPKSRALLCYACPFLYLIEDRAGALTKLDILASCPSYEMIFFEKPNPYKFRTGLWMIHTSKNLIEEFDIQNRQAKKQEAPEKLAKRKNQMTKKL